MNTLSSGLAVTAILSFYVFAYYALLSAFGAVPDLTRTIVNMFKVIYYATTL